MYAFTFARVAKEKQRSGAHKRIAENKKEKCETMHDLRM